MRQHRVFEQDYFSTARARCEDLMERNARVIFQSVRRGGGMADATDLYCLSTPDGNTGVNGVKVGGNLTGHADVNAELRPVWRDRRLAKCRDETAPS